MKKLYIDFDNTIVKSNEKIIEILNERYNLNKSENDLTDYSYKSIAPVEKDEILDIFASDDFFKNLKFKDGVLDFLEKHKSDFKFIISTKGTKDNLNKKKKWLDNNFPYKFDFIGLESNSLSKKKINMKNGIQIDDCTKCLNTNAEIKILYKDFYNFDWQNGYENKNIIVVNSWSDIDEILSFYLKYDYKTLNII